MIGKIIGAIAGSKMAEHTRGLGGPTGAALGVGAAAIARRLSLPALVAITAGGYLAKKYSEKKEAEKAAPVSAANANTAKAA
jgi:hypothetical protein